MTYVGGLDTSGHVLECVQFAEPGHGVCLLGRQPLHLDRPPAEGDHLLATQEVCKLCVIGALSERQNTTHGVTDQE